MASDEPLGTPALSPALRTLEAEYEFLREVGRGGMAAVYLARARASDRVVAIKTVAAHRAHDPEAVARFEREARTVLALDHPNIVRSYAVEQLGGGALAIVMQHVSGGTLRDALREAQRTGEPFAPERVARIVGDVAAALAHAHDRGVVHRDVKPENIFLDPRNGRALLSDFGIARNLEGDNALTMTGSAIGTPTYMSPEQIDGRRVDGRSDVYALGLVGWEMLAGARPWEGDSLYTVIYKQKHETLAPLAELRPDAPPPLRDAIERALQKDPGDRWPDAYAFEDAVRATLPADSVPVVFEAPPSPMAPELATTVGPPADAPADGESGLAPGGETAPYTVGGSSAASTAASPAVADALASSPDEREPTFPPDSRDATPVDELRPPVPLSPIMLDERPRVVPGPPPRGGHSARRASLRLAVPLSLAVVVGLAVREGARSRRSHADAAGDSSATAITLPAGGEVASPAAESAATPRTTGTVAPPSRSTTSGAGGGRGSDARLATRTAPATTTAAAATPTNASASNAASRAPVGLARFALTHGDSLALCRSPAARDQRACFTAVLADRDVPLNAVYAQLVREMRRSDAPTAVSQLRAEELRWLAARDADCARAGRGREGTLWAPSRAACLGDAADRRAAELRTRLGQLRAR